MMRLAAILDSPETLYSPTRRIAMQVSDSVKCRVRSTGTKRGRDPQHVVTMHDNRISGRPPPPPRAWSRRTPYCCASTEYALEEQARGWVTLSRHASATAAADAMYEFGLLLQRRVARIVEVAPYEIVRDGEPDLRPSPRVIGTYPDGDA